MFIRWGGVGVWLVMTACDGSPRALDAGVDTTTLLDASLDASLGVDLDGDGFTTVDDCDDGDAAIHPGAVEACDAIDQDCDGIIDDTAATFDPGTGPVDVSAALAGTLLAPAHYTPPTAGVLRLCGASTYYVHLTATADLEVLGQGLGTTLDGGRLDTVLATGAYGVTLTVHDLTVTHGLGNDGGGVRCTMAGNLNITNAAIVGNEASLGGGIFVDSCTVAITDTAITDNLAGLGGGLCDVFGFETITRATFTGNTASEGTAIHTNLTSLDLRDSIVDANLEQVGSTLFGGALYVSGVATCTTSSITRNTGFGVFVSGTFTSSSCSYGVDAATNNAPHDVMPELGTARDYVAAESFACTADACN